METVYLRGTSRQRSPAAPALTSPLFTHTERQIEKERRTALCTLTKRRIKVCVRRKNKSGGNSAEGGKKDEAETNKPFSPASPRTDRLHPGPWTISERICPARTYPTLSCLGKAAATDGGVSAGCVGDTMGCHRSFLAAVQMSCWVFFFSWSGKRRSEVELLLLLLQEASAAL